MKISNLSTKTISRLLGATGLPLQIGPFVINLHTKIPQIAEHISFFYSDYYSPERDVYLDHHIKLKQAGGFRRWIKPQVMFLHDQYSPFKPLPFDQAFALFEWGLNWCIASTAHHYFIVHAAVIEKDGKAIILPGMPGAGKSTLCSAMCLSGWRLLSDEMALIDPDTLEVSPIPRPVSLKNQSIEIIRKFSTKAAIGPSVKDTAKGTLAHLKPLEDSVIRSKEKVYPYAIVFPKYRENSDTYLRPQEKASALLEIQNNAFNTHVLGVKGFNIGMRLVNQSILYSLEYSKLDEAISLMDEVLTLNKAPAGE